jgi:hypothetical protein
MSQQPPDEPKNNGPSSWRRQPKRIPGQSARRGQQFRQFHWPPQPFLQRPPRTLWQRYLRSRKARIGSILLILLLIGGLAFTTFRAVTLTVFHTLVPQLPIGVVGHPLTATPALITGTHTVTGPLGPVRITVDFGGRQNHAYPISSTFLGVGGLGLTNVINAAAPYLPQANLRLTRVGDFMADIFPTAASATNPTQQNWTKLNTVMQIFLENKLQPILILNYTPAWLQPQNQNPPLPNPCITSVQTDASHIKPTFMVNGQDLGPQKWGELAAQVVAHMDTNFPQIHPLYEIWNEPDGIAYWCESDSGPTANQERLTQYKELYAAAAPLMKQQAQKDGVQIKVGGPALAYVEVRATTWIPALVNDPNVAPYIDFISYHQYRGGATWDELISKTQDRQTGYTAEFQQIDAYVRAGRQPNAQSTPIYIDEYNGNSCSPNVCRNDPTYAPLWNSLFIADLLDAVITPIVAQGTQAIPAGVVYFTWSAPPGQFCMFGTIDAKYDCAAGNNAQAYPQFYAYKLIGGPDYLNITDGGYVASTVSSNLPGVVVAGFFTNSKDNILITNPTGQAYTRITVFARNPGKDGNSAMVYTLDKENLAIAQQQIGTQQGNGGYSVAIQIPAYSTVAISL